LSKFAPHIVSQQALLKSIGSGLRLMGQALEAGSGAQGQGNVVALIPRQSVLTAL